MPLPISICTWMVTDDMNNTVDDRNWCGMHTGSFKCVMSFNPIRVEWSPMYKEHPSELAGIQIDMNWIDAGCTGSNYMAWVNDTICIHHLFASSTVLITCLVTSNMYIEIAKGKFAITMSNLPFWLDRLYMHFVRIILFLCKTPVW